MNHSDKIEAQTSFSTDSFFNRIPCMQDCLRFKRKLSSIWSTIYSDFFYLVGLLGRSDYYFKYLVCNDDKN